MKLALVYDVETTGIPIWSTPSDDPAQPRVIELAAELVDTDTRKVLTSMDFIIKPDGWTIPEEIEILTGITNEMAELVGVPMHMVLPMFVAMWTLADQRVGHNESFDMRMIRIELMRHAKLGAMADDWKAGEAFCTQVKSTKIINLPPTAKMLAAKRNTPKSPNLGEAFAFFAEKPLVDAHRAAVDVMACRTVYFGILDHQATLVDA